MECSLWALPVSAMIALFIIPSSYYSLDYYQHELQSMPLIGSHQNITQVLAIKTYMEWVIEELQQLSKFFFYLLSSPPRHLSFTLQVHFIANNHQLDIINCILYNAHRTKIPHHIKRLQLTGYKFKMISLHIWYHSTGITAHRVHQYCQKEDSPKRDCNNTVSIPSSTHVASFFIFIVKNVNDVIVNRATEFFLFSLQKLINEDEYVEPVIFCFHRKTEAEFGGLRQNFLLAHTLENELKITPQVLELKKRATLL